MEENNIFIFQVRVSRQKSMDIAFLEAFTILNDLGAIPMNGGPLSDKKGIFCITVPEKSYFESLERISHLGYTRTVYVADFNVVPSKKDSAKYFNWKGRFFKLVTIYNEDEEIMRNKAPDRRTFYILDDKGESKKIDGYRGDGSETGRRALPVCDSRALVNLVYAPQNGKFLDPFAGGGGIILEAVEWNFDVYSVDIDPVLRPGLEYYGAEHYVMDARKLSFADEEFSMIATEIPFSINSTSVVTESMEEIVRILKPMGKISMMAASYQVNEIREKAKSLELFPILDSKVDRKGTDVHLFCWQKPK